MRREVRKTSYHKVEGTQLITGVFHSVRFTNHLRLINSVSGDQRKPKMQQTMQETTSILNSNRQASIYKCFSAFFSSILKSKTAA